MSTEFTATTPDELLYEYNHKMNALQDDLSAKIATAGKKEKFDKVKDLPVISFTDGEIDESEVDMLYNLCRVLNIRP